MDHRPHLSRAARRRTVHGAVAALCAVALVSACGAQDATPTRAPAGGLLDDTRVHDVDIAFDDADYDAMIATFESTGEKGWITATVTIDGTTYADVGLRLKGNSSLQGLRQDGGAGGGGPGGEVSAEDPETLPWLIRLDKYVDGQEHDGRTQVVVRSNRTESSLNEAVALELVELAGLASQDAAAARFSVNGGEEDLRLLVENPDDAWDAATFGTEGVLYKAESGGDYSYRGEDPASYTDVFDQETRTDDEDLSPLIEFLDFINTSDDATFAADLDQHLDVDAFARYLAVQELVANVDDIDGPGNNSYLRFDEEAGTFTVVTWDLNLAFGGLGAGGPAGEDGAGLGDGFVPPQGVTPPSGGTPPSGVTPPGDGDVRGDRPMPGAPAGGGIGGRGGDNVLVERFMAVPELAAAYEAALVDLREQLYSSGAAQAVLDRWTTVLQEQAGDLLDQETLATESAAVAGFFTTEAVTGTPAVDA